MSHTTLGPLHGFRVLDLATERGEYAGRVLADLGAEVIKVEPPGGVASRRVAPFAGDARGGGDASLFWEAVAAGKKSVVLDIRSEADRGDLLRLIDGADVLIESFEPGEMAEIGLGYQNLSQRNPALIYVSITPYGQSGPDALKPATDLTVEAASCMLGLQGDGDRPPIPIGYPQAFFHAGAQAAADAVCALVERDHSGRGQHLDVSAQAAMIWVLLQATGYPSMTGEDPPRSGERRLDLPPETVPGYTAPAHIPCADGRVMFACASGPTLNTFLAWMVREDRLDPELLTFDMADWQQQVAAGQMPLSHYRAVVTAVCDFVATKTKVELMDYACHTLTMLAAVNTTKDLADDPHLAERGYWKQVDGRIAAGAFALMSETPLVPPRPAPELGADQSLVDSEHRPEVSPAALHSSSRRDIFAGLKVADFSWVGVGPIIAKFLADHGATVVRVESSTRVDMARLLPPFKDNVPGVNRGQLYGNFNTSKLSLALNLGSKAGLKVARRLADWGDVVLESFSPGAFKKMGLGYDVLSADRPELVMLSTCLRGQTGPQATFRGYGAQGAGLAGFYEVTGWPDREPTGPYGAYTDFITPRFGLAALASAILYRERTGIGQYIDLSQVEAAVRFIEPLVLDYAVNGRIAGPAGHESDRACPHGVYRTAGTERFIAIAVETAEQWQRLQTLVRLTAFEGIEFDDLATRLAAKARIERAIAEWTLGQDCWELDRQLAAAGVPSSVVLRPSDIHANNQLNSRGFFWSYAHPEQGLVPYDGPATRYSATPMYPRSHAPTLGEHTDTVMREILGFGEAEIAALKVEGALQ